MNTKYPYDIMNITPMDKFNDFISDWWQAYNDIKHRRTQTNDAGRYNYTKANLKNVLYAMAALYILNRKQLTYRQQFFYINSWMSVLLLHSK